MLVVVCSFCEHPLSVMCFVKYHKNLVTGAIKEPFYHIIIIINSSEGKVGLHSNSTVVGMEKRRRCQRRP